MRLQHYAYFLIASPVLTGEEIAARIGLAADEVAVRGSRRADPPVPVQHGWRINSDQSEPLLFVQVEKLLERIVPVEAAIAALLREYCDEIGCVLRIVRNYDTADGWLSDEALGLAIDKEHVALLGRLGASVDMDEYDSGVEDIEHVGIAANRRHLWLAPHRNFDWARRVQSHFHAPTGEIGPFTLLLALGEHHSDAEIDDLARVLRGQDLVFLCAWGPDCERIHDRFDAVRDAEPDAGRPFLMTTWHAHDTLSDALRFAISGSAPDTESDDRPIHSVIAATDRSDWQAELRALLASHAGEQFRLPLTCDRTASGPAPRPPLLRHGPAAGTDGDSRCGEPRTRGHRSSSCRQGGRFGAQATEPADRSSRCGHACRHRWAHLGDRLERVVLVVSRAGLVGLLCTRPGTTAKEGVSSRTRESTASGLAGFAEFPFGAIQPNDAAASLRVLGGGPAAQEARAVAAPKVAAVVLEVVAQRCE